MAHLIIQQKDFELNEIQLKIIQSGFYKCDDNQNILIESAFDIDLVELFLKIIEMKENSDEINKIPKHNIYMLFLLAKSWGIKKYQNKFGNFLFGPEYKVDINPNCNELIPKNIQDPSNSNGFSSYKIHSMKYRAEIEFSSVLNEKCLVDILDDDNPWFYQSNPNDIAPYIIIYFEDKAHDIDSYSLKTSKLPIPLLNSKKWLVEALVKGKKKSSTPVWKTIDTVFIVKNPKANELITRKSLVHGNFLAVKITAKDKKLSLHSISFQCNPLLEYKTIESSNE